MGAINFDNFSNWGNISNQQVTQSGPSNKNTDGNSMSTQTGNANSLQWGNKNSYQYGVSNSVLVGMSFSTNVAATISTTVGVPFSFQLAGSVSVFAGPKFSYNRSTELSISYANKYTWTKDETEYELKEGSFEVTDKKAKFAKDADEWLGTKNLVAKDEIKKVLDGDMQYATLTTKVAGQCNTTAAAVALKGAGQFTMSTMGKMALEGAAGITMESLKVQINGTIVNLG